MCGVTKKFRSLFLGSVRPSAVLQKMRGCRASLSSWCCGKFAFVPPPGHGKGDRLSITSALPFSGEAVVIPADHGAASGPWCRSWKTPVEKWLGYVVVLPALPQRTLCGDHFVQRMRLLSVGKDCVILSPKLQKTAKLWAERSCGCGGRPGWCVQSSERHLGRGK